MPSGSEPAYGQHFAPEVRNVIKLTLAFAAAVGARQNDPADNLMVSPYNHLRFLSMIAKGAGGKTREEMARILFDAAPEELDGEIEKLIALNKKILESNKDQVVLKTATALWVNSDLAKLDEKYASEMERLFESKVTEGSFATDPSLVTDANTWASDNTKEKPEDEKGLIDHIVDEFDGDMALFLASALYFKGMWTNKFDVKLTKERKFTADGDNPYMTMIMHRHFGEGEVTYQEGEDYEAVALTYGETDYEKGKYPSMRIVLVRPADPQQSARSWMAEQADGTVPAWLDPRAYEKVLGTVELPHMDIEQRHKLIPPFHDAGLKNTLGSSPDFSRMLKIPGRAEVSFINEDIVFKTDENGSEGASIVSGGIRTTSAPMPVKRIDVKLNRSFVLAVQDINTGAVLFAGAVNKPNGKMKPAPGV